MPLMYYIVHTRSCTYNKKTISGIRGIRQRRNITLVSNIMNGFGKSSSALRALYIFSAACIHQNKREESPAHFPPNGENVQKKKGKTEPILPLV